MALSDMFILWPDSAPVMARFSTILYVLLMTQTLEVISVGLELYIRTKYQAMSLRLGLLQSFRDVPLTESNAYSPLRQG